MGLIRDALGSALGGHHLNNGFSRGPQQCSDTDEDIYGSLSLSQLRSFRSTRQRGPLVDDESHYRRRSDLRNDIGRLYRRGGDGLNDGQTSGAFDGQQHAGGLYQGDFYDRTVRNNGDHDSRSEQLSPAPYYAAAAISAGSWAQQARNSHYYQDETCNQEVEFSNGTDFRPLVLPQIGYGDDQPFLRGYSLELNRYGISMEAFITFLDAINVALMPSPENQIFQKGANIAGFFL